MLACVAFLTSACHGLGPTISEPQDHFRIFVNNESELPVVVRMAQWPKGKKVVFRVEANTSGALGFAMSGANVTVLQIAGCRVLGSFDLGDRYSGYPTVIVGRDGSATLAVEDPLVHADYAAGGTYSVDPCLVGGIAPKAIGVGSDEYSAIQ